MAKQQGKPVNPIDEEIKSEMTKSSPVPPVEESKSMETFEQEIDVKYDGNDPNPFADPSEPVDVIPLPEREIILPKRYFVSECLYRPTNVERGEYDFSEFLIDMETIQSIEKIFPERLLDFGVGEKEAELNNMMDGCIIYASAFAEEMIVLDYSFEELIQNLIEYRGNETSK